MKPKLIMGHTDTWHREHKVLTCNYCQRIKNTLRQKIKSNGLTQDDIKLLNQIKAMRHQEYLKQVARIANQKLTLTQAIEDNNLEDASSHTREGEHEINNYQQQIVCTTHKTILR